MRRLIIFIAIICMPASVEADTKSRNFLSFVEMALKSYSSTAKRAVLVQDLSSRILLENGAGAIEPKHWTDFPDEKFKRLIKLFNDGNLRWEASNVSALAAKGSSMIVFADGDGEVLFGLIHENRWKEGQYRPAMVSGNLGSSISLDGVIEISFINRKRDPIRDVPYVLDSGIYK